MYFGVVAVIRTKFGLFRVVVIFRTNFWKKNLGRCLSGQKIEILLRTEKADPAGKHRHNSGRT